MTNERGSAGVPPPPTPPPPHTHTPQPAVMSLLRLPTCGLGHLCSHNNIAETHPELLCGDAVCVF